MSFPRYPAYKPSGVEWLGKVPEHWSIKQLKHCIHRLGSGGTPESGNPDYWADNESDDSIPWVAIGDMSSASIVHSTAKSLTQAGVREKNLEIFPAGSLLYSIYASLGKVSILGVDAAFNQAILAIVSNPKLVSQSFLKYWLESIEKHLSYYSSSNTQANLNAAKVLAYPVAVPHPDEQARIANFLDRETAKIDALIAEQQRLIELLQEKQQAVISHAVTKGLNPNAPMKYSGVEWLGEVPEHWEIKAVKHLCSLLRDGTHLPPPREATGIPLLSVRNIQEEQFALRDDDSFISEDSYEELCRSFSPQPGDTLLAIVGATMGKTAIVPSDIGKFHIQRSLGIFRTKSELLHPEWLNFVFRSSQFNGLLWRDVAFSAQPGIYLGALKDVPIPVPSLPEQSEILKTSNRKLHDLNLLVAAAQDAVALHHERRSALISTAVTGQIDIRGLATEEEP